MSVTLRRLRRVRRAENKIKRAMLQGRSVREMGLGLFAADRAEVVASAAAHLLTKRGVFGRSIARGELLPPEPGIEEWEGA